MLNLVGQRLGNYEIISRFGEGGMAAVYKARQVNIKREVAIKVILPSLAQREEFKKRFDKEAELSASLSHPNIVKIFDYGVARGFHLALTNDSIDARKDVYFIVMELLTGGSLASKITREPLPLSAAVPIIEQIGSALDYAASRGLIHRDLKPGNVLFDAQGNAILSDFGIARLEGDKQQITQDGMAMGTPAYMAPEMWEEVELTPSLDIYALGVLLYEMLTTKLPFYSRTPYAIMKMHRDDPVPSVSKHVEGIPPGVDEVIRKAMGKTVETRYPKAMQMARDLKKVAAAAESDTVLLEKSAEAKLSPALQAERARAVSGKPADAPQKPGIPLNPKRILPLIAVGVTVIVILLLILAGRG